MLAAAADPNPIPDPDPIPNLNIALLAKLYCNAKQSTAEPLEDDSLSS
jgi:hypothetical protein